MKVNSLKVLGSVIVAAVMLLVIVAFGGPAMGANETQYSPTPTPNVTASPTPTASPSPSPSTTPATDDGTLTLQGRELLAYRLGYLSATIEGKTADLQQLQTAQKELVKELKAK